MNIGCVLLAAGLSERFGTNKLLTKFFGKTLIENTMTALPPELFERAIVVTAYEEIAHMARAQGFEVAMNDKPKAGICRSIALGLEKMQDMDSCLFCVCDQPYINSLSVRSMLSNYTDGIAALSIKGKRGNPVIFPQELFCELAELKVGESGGAVIARHEDILTLHRVSSPLELMDIDTAEDFEKLEGVKNLFLTGERGSGKSTLLGYTISYAELIVSGFITRQYEINGRQAGHYMHALSANIKYGENDKPISVKTGEQTCIAVPKIFDDFGAKYIDAAIKDNANIILMDELGTLEQNEEQFKAQVFAALDSEKLVIGSLKAAGGWLEDIADRPDTLVLELSRENRDEVLARVLGFLNNH